MMKLIVLESSWQWARLCWYGDNGWLAMIDRAWEQLDDATVDRQFGSEAFRRRDDLIARGIEHGTYDPLGVPLLGRTVTDALRASGWRQRLAVQRDRAELGVAQSLVVLESGGDLVPYPQVPELLALRLQGGDERRRDMLVQRCALQRAVGGEPEQVVAFVDVQPERTSQRGEDLGRGMRPPACSRRV